MPRPPRRPSRRATSAQPRSHPLDRVARLAMLALAVGMAGLMLFGDHASAKVRDFSWQNRQVGVEDRAFLITFSRPMDPASVEANLTIDPPLAGKVSWAGRRMAYTLTDPIPYGQSFRVTLPTARDRYSAQANKPGRFEPFVGEFQTRKRGFLYLGTEGEETHRLVLANLDQQERVILTPKDLTVLDFEPYPLGDKVLFSAIDAAQTEGLVNQQLYTVTTGIQPQPPVDLMAEPPSLWQRLRTSRAPATSGQVELVLSNQDYQNLKFDLSPDGQIIVVQRVSQTNPADFGPWVVPPDGPPYRLDTDPGGDFLIGPDSQSLVLLQGEGTAIIDLQPTSQNGPRQPLDFLPNYGRVLDISRDGSTAAMVNFNQNDPAKRFTESLFLVTSQGQEEERLQVSGSILSAQFDPTKRFLYVLASEQVELPSSAETLSLNEGYGEQPLLLALDLQEKTILKLLKLPQQPRIHMSLSPNGRSLLLDLEGSNEALPNPNATSSPSLWYLPLFQSEGQTQPAVVEPERFPFNGLQATWLP